MNKQLTYGAVVAYIAVAINIIYTLFVTPAIVKGLGDGHYAIYVLNNSIISFFCIDFGLGLASTKFISNARAEDNFTLLNNYIGVINFCYLIIALIIGFIFFLLYNNLDYIFNQEGQSDFYLAKRCFLLSAIYCTLNIPFLILNSLLISFEKNIQIKSCDICLKALSFILILLSLSCNFDLYGVILSNIISGFFILLLKIFFVNKIAHVNILFVNFNKIILSKIFKFNIWATIDSISARLVFLVGPIILNFIAKDIDVAIFGIIIALEGASYSIICALNNTFVSKISKLLTKSKDTILIFFDNICCVQTFIAGLILIEFIGIGNWFLEIWIGKHIEIVYYCMITILISTLWLSPLQTISMAVVLKSGIKNIAKISLIVGLSNVVLMSIVSYYYGVIGASLSIACSNLVRMVLLFLLFKNEFMFGFGRYISKMRNFNISIVIIAVVTYYCSCQVTTYCEAITIAVILFAVICLLFFFCFNTYGKKFNLKSIFS